jgi:hypothetical protein
VVDGTAVASSVNARQLSPGANFGSIGGLFYSEFFIQDDVTFSTAGPHTVSVQVEGGGGFVSYENNSDFQTLRVIDYTTIGTFGSTVNQPASELNYSFPSATVVPTTATQVGGLSQVITVSGGPDTVRLEAEAQVYNQSTTGTSGLLTLEFRVTGATTLTSPLNTFRLNPNDFIDPYRTFDIEADVTLNNGTNTISLLGFASNANTLVYSTVGHDTLRITDYRNVTGANVSPWVVPADVNSNAGGLANTQLSTTATQVPGLTQTITLTNSASVRLEATGAFRNQTNSAYGVVKMYFQLSGATTGTTTGNLWVLYPADTTSHGLNTYTQPGDHHHSGDGGGPNRREWSGRLVGSRRYQRRRTPRHRLPAAPR